MPVTRYYIKTSTDMDTRLLKNVFKASVEIRTRTADLFPMPLTKIADFIYLYVLRKSVETKMRLYV